MYTQTLCTRVNASEGVSENNGDVDEQRALAIGPGKQKKVQENSDASRTEHTHYVFVFKFEKFHPHSGSQLSVPLITMLSLGHTDTHASKTPVHIK